MGINTTICLYYSRNTYTLTLNKGNYISSVTGGGTYKVGQSVTISAEILKSDNQYTYAWAGWKSSNSSVLSDIGTKNTTIRMPAGDVTLTANARRSERTYSLTIKHYLENTNDNNFTLLNDKTTYNNTIKYGSTISLENYKTTIEYGEYSYGSLTDAITGGTATPSTTMYGDTTICLYYIRPVYNVTYHIINYSKSPSDESAIIQMKAGSVFNRTAPNYNYDDGGLNLKGHSDRSGYDGNDVVRPGSRTYTFVGWVDSAFANTEYKKSFVVEKNCEVYAQWEEYRAYSGGFTGIYYGETAKIDYSGIAVKTVNYGGSSSGGSWSGVAYSVYIENVTPGTSITNNFKSTSESGPGYSKGSNTKIDVYRKDTRQYTTSVPDC